ncbi:MAG: hypothetical protein M3Q87_02245 [Actinomycetota bacterium]|nr:hypothetical protein [Actinomycetota bacterium]
MATLSALVVCFFLLVPLQWVGLGSTPLGDARLHQVATIGLGLLLLLRWPLRAYAPVLRTGAVFVLANLYMIAAIAGAQMYNDLGIAPPAQQLLYLVICAAFAVLFYRIASGQEAWGIPTLRFVGAAAGVSLVVGLGVAMTVNGINPATVMAQTIATADPAIFQKEVFKSAFAGFGLDEERVVGNLRHEMFGSVLLAMLVSTWAMRVGPEPTRAHILAHRTGLVIGVLVLTVSLSRSVLIAALVWPLLALMRTAGRGELSARQIALGMLSLAGLAGLVVSGLGAVIYNRFATDTTGYKSRVGSYADAFATLPDVWVTGGYATRNISSHNLVFDTLLRNGVFAALPAAVVAGVVVVAFVLLAAQVHRQPPWFVPVVGVLALPLIRMWTSGGGTVPPNEWVALAFVLGVLSWWRRVGWTDPPDHPAGTSISLGRATRELTS